VPVERPDLRDRATVPANELKPMFGLPIAAALKRQVHAVFGVVLRALTYVDLTAKLDLSPDVGRRAACSACAEARRPSSACAIVTPRRESTTSTDLHRAVRTRPLCARGGPRARRVVALGRRRRGLTGRALQRPPGSVDARTRPCRSEEPRARASETARSSPRTTPRFGCCSSPRSPRGLSRHGGLERGRSSRAYPRRERGRGLCVVIVDFRRACPRWTSGAP
jgi:hypothetical protein